MLRCLRIVLTFALLGLVVFFGHGIALEKAGRYLLKKDELKPADVIVVLSGESRERVEYGVRLFQEDWAKRDRIIFTGGPVVWKYSWAALMRDHAISLGLPSRAAILEEKSGSTEEEARYVRDILRSHGFRSIILVTSPYHSRRASAIFGKVMGEDVKIISAPAEESWFRFDKWWNRRGERSKVLSEYAKFVWFWIFGIEEHRDGGGGPETPALKK